METDGIEGNLNYDVASKLLGEDWRMPTPYECKELLELCCWEVQVIDGVEGSKIIDPNDNSIFLPFNSMNYIMKKYFRTLLDIFSKGRLEKLCTRFAIWRKQQNSN